MGIKVERETKVTLSAECGQSRPWKFAAQCERGQHPKLATIFQDHWQMKNDAQAFRELAEFCNLIANELDGSDVEPARR